MVKQKVSKVLIGSGYERGRLIWMNGTPEEIVERLRKSYKIYEQRPTKEVLSKVNGKKEEEPVAAE